MSTRTQKLLYNSLAAAIYSFTSVIVGLILPRLIITTFGSELNGLTASIRQIVSYLTYLEAGLGASFIYALYKPLAHDERDMINNLITQAKKSYIKTSIMYLAGTLMLSLVYPAVIQRGEIEYLTASLLVIVIGMSGVLEFYTLAKFRVLIVADQKAYIINYMSFITLLLNLGLSIVLIKLNASIIMVMLIPLVSLLFRTIILNIYVKKQYPYINYKGQSNTMVLDKRFDAMLMEISKTINLSFPVVAISLFCSMQIVSVYAIYNLVFSGIKTVLQIITNGISASFGNIMAKGENKILQKANEEFEVLVYSTLSFLYACTLILIIPFITVYVMGVKDSDMYIDFSYGLLFVIWGYLHNSRLPQTSLISAGGLFKEARFTNLSQIVLVVTLLLVLVPTFDLKGALIAMIISALYKTIAMIIIVKKEIINNSGLITSIRLFRGFIIIAICYIPFMGFIKIVPTNLYEWFLYAIPVSIWCITITTFTLIIFDRKIFFNLIIRFKKIARI